MREIKFRVWDEADGLHFNKSEYSYYDGYLPQGDYTAVEQYTGLKDKNGVEIYEGDVLKCVSSYGGIFTAEVKFKDGCFEIEQRLDSDSAFRDYLKCLTVNGACKIIGNIHENKELLS